VVKSDDGTPATGGEYVKAVDKGLTSKIVLKAVDKGVSRDWGDGSEER
jgi:hypothetical protein